MVPAQVQYSRARRRWHCAVTHHPSLDHAMMHYRPGMDRSSEFARRWTQAARVCQRVAAEPRWPGPASDSGVRVATAPGPGPEAAALASIRRRPAALRAANPSLPRAGPRPAGRLSGSWRRAMPATGPLLPAIGSVPGFLHGLGQGRQFNSLSCQGHAVPD